MPRYDDQQHAQRHDDDVGVLQEQVGDVLGGQEIHIQHPAHHGGKEEHDGHQRQQHPVFAQVPAEQRLDPLVVTHHAAFPWFFRIIAMIRSWLASARDSSPTIRPSFIT